MQSTLYLARGVSHLYEVLCPKRRLLQTLALARVRKLVPPPHTVLSLLESMVFV